MKDSPAQTGAQPAYASQPSALRERLLRLLIEPAGVIDVRYAQQKYARIAEWLDKRTELLRQLQTRYGVAAGLAYDEPLLMHEPSGEPVNFHSTAVQSFSTVQYFSAGQSPLTAGQAIYAAGQSATPEVAAQFFSPAELTQTFADSATPPASTGETPISAGEALPPHTPRRVTDLSQLPEGEFRVSRRRAQFNSSPVSPAAPGLPLADTRTRTAVAADEPGGSEPVAARGAKASDAKTSEQNVSAAPSRVEPQATAREVVQTKSVQTESAQTAPHASLPALPLAYARPAASTAEVREGGGRPSGQPTGPQPVERTASAAGEREPVAGKRESVVATEIKDDSFTQAGPEIVWRKGPSNAPAIDTDARGQNSSDGGGSPARNARQADGHSAERPAQQSPTINSSVKGQERGGEIRIEQLSPQVIHTISEKVMRAISLDLAVELERRGLKKWR